MPSNNNTTIELTEQKQTIYAYDSATGDGCHGSTRGEALYNLGCRLERKKNRKPASPDDVEEILNTE